METTLIGCVCEIKTNDYISLKTGTISLSDKILEVGYSTIQADKGQFGVHTVCKVVVCLVVVR